MNPDEFSSSIFTLEADGNPVLAIAAKTHAQAERELNGSQVQKALRAAMLCDKDSNLHVRLARTNERARYYGQVKVTPELGGLPAVYLTESGYVDEQTP